LSTIAPRGYLSIWADADIKDQGVHAGFKLNADGGSFFPGGGGGGQAINYGMDPDVVNHARYKDWIDDTLLSIPSISLVTGLANDGERIKLVDAIGTVIHDFRYDDAWYDRTDGDGHSLTAVNPANPDKEQWSQEEGWRASKKKNGSPAAPDTTS
jgi:hypothetical protein